MSIALSSFGWKVFSWFRFEVKGQRDNIILYLYQVPESPVWLLMKGRKDEARASLAWLRGWVKQESVSREFRGMEAHCEASKLNSPVSSPTTPPLPYIPVPSNETGGKYSPIICWKISKKYEVPMINKN